MKRETLDRLLGFVGFAEIHVERGNLDAVRDALADARAVLDGERSPDISAEENEACA